MKARRLTARKLILAFLALALLFALQGGEYSTWDFLTLKRQEREERARIAELEPEVDSLRREAIAVERDPATQERLARELYGMLKPGEFLYNIIHEEGGQAGRRAGGR
ncbi:MAG TPA: septum formation initiator family protein [Gemmatimonadales bacterium]|nr:septum formation initiator family protein [Gemmatimonadales bacterium]